jgi:hypothetical protein
LSRSPGTSIAGRSTSTAYQAMRRPDSIPEWVIDITPNQKGSVLVTAGLADTTSVMEAGTSACSCNDLKP